MPIVVCVFGPLSYFICGAHSVEKEAAAMGLSRNSRRPSNKEIDPMKVAGKTTRKLFFNYSN